MSKKKKDQTPEKNADSFGLSAPTERIEELRKESETPDEGSHIIHDMSAVQQAEAKFKQMGWKGIDDDEEVHEPDFEVKKEPIPEDELDMTPMVDVTFLLLIFFMVTASFTLQKSIEQPPAQTDAPSSQTVDEEIEDDYVEIIIDQTNTYYVTTRDEAEAEAPSEREMRSRLKDAKENSNANWLIIRAHVDCMHRKVVTAWDAGIAVGMDRIEVQTTEEDF